MCSKLKNMCLFKKIGTKLHKFYSKIINMLSLVKFYFQNLIIKLSYNRIIVCVIIAVVFSLICGLPILILQCNHIGLDIKKINAPGISFSNPATLLSLGGTIVSMSLAIYALAMNAFSKANKSLISEITSDSDHFESSNTMNIAIEIVSLRFRGLGLSFVFPPFNFPLLSKLFSMIGIFTLMLIQTFVGEFRIIYLCIFLSIMLFSLMTFVFEVFYIFSDKNFFYNRVSHLIVNKIHKRLRFLETYNTKYKKYFLNVNEHKLSEGFQTIVKENTDYAKVDIIHAITFLNKTFNKINYRTKHSTKNYVLDLNKKKHYDRAFLDILLSMNTSQIVLQEDENVQAELENVKNEIQKYILSGNVILKIEKDEIIKQIDEDKEISKDYGDELKEFVNGCVSKRSMIKYE